jgi:hypothetical protein
MNDFAHVSRNEPVLPPGAYQTYEATAPLATHWRAATCEEVGCKAYTQGWTTDVVPDSPDEQRMTATYGRRFLVEKLENGFHRWHFPAGTVCFRVIFHKLPLERPAIFTVRSGDWRGTDGVIREFKDGEQWVDAFATHQDGISKLVNRG